MVPGGECFIRARVIAGIACAPFWKVILSADKAIAWYIPNRSDLATLDSYLVSITELEAKLGATMVGIDAPESLKVSRATWAQLAGCSLS